jgi:hypothetical protein
LLLIFSHLGATNTSKIIINNQNREAPLRRLVIQAN